MNNLGEQFIWFFGVIEDRGDPLRLGRVRVRCYGWHTDDKNELPTKDLPWSQPLQPITSSGMSGFGNSSVGLLEGSLVVGFFIDGYDAQQPIIMGSIAGMPTEKVNTLKGFSDPNGLYPSSRNESDLNRLARNDSEFPHPLIRRKKDNQVTSVPIANSINTWNEPQYAYNAKYPYNHVQQSESGHIREIDDTINDTRIHEYHRSGTFYEIDDVGNRTLKIEGDDYKIVIGNGNLYVDGNLNITVAKKLNIKCKELNIEVSNDVNKKYGGNEIEQIGGNVTQTIVGNEEKTVGGNLTQTIVGNEIEKIGGNVTQTIVGDEEKTVGGNITIGSVGDYIHESKNIHLNKLSTPPDEPEALDEVSSISVSSSGAKLGNPSFSTPGGAQNSVAVTNVLAANGSITTITTSESTGPQNNSGGPVYAEGIDVPPAEVKQRSETAIASGPSACNRASLGSVSAEFESNGKPGIVGFDSTGGYSYGLYQISTADAKGGAGTFPKFMVYLKDEHPKYHDILESVGGYEAARGDVIGPNNTQERTVKFKEKWKQLATENKDEFTKIQHDFIQRSHYDPAVNNIKKDSGIDLCDGTHSAGLQDAIWSTSVQHGSRGAKNIFMKALENVKNATGKKTTEITDKELIEAIYDERGRDGGNAYFKNSKQSIKDSVVNRFKKEKAKALSMV